MYKGERFNSITHVVGAGLALAGGAVLISLAANDGDASRVVSYTIYGLTLTLLYTTSALYHGLPGRAKNVFRVLDHQAIYLLIAGTYTPFIALALEGVQRWVYFGSIWGLAVLGIVLDAVQRGRTRTLQLVIYLVMGWLCVFALDSLFAALSGTGVVFLVAGGVFYTSGIAFFVLDERVPWFHGIWHLFVLAGSMSHYFAILLLG